VVVAILIFVVFIWIIVKSSGNSKALQNQTALEANGVRGRALVLSSDMLTSSVTINAQLYERRTMTLDIEIPGRAPYTTTGQFLIARGLVEPVPGASLDVAVDPKDQNQVAVLGPGGFSGPWIRVGIPNPY
jgi:hypothetical protein